MNKVSTKYLNAFTFPWAYSKQHYSWSKLFFCYESFFDNPGQLSFIWFINKKQYGSVLFPPLKNISYWGQLVSLNPHWCGFLRIIFWLNMRQGQIKLNNNTSLDSSSALKLLQLGQTTEQTIKLVLLLKV